MWGAGFDESREFIGRATRTLKEDLNVASRNVLSTDKVAVLFRSFPSTLLNVVSTPTACKGLKTKLTAVLSISTEGKKSVSRNWKTDEDKIVPETF